MLNFHFSRMCLISGVVLVMLLGCGGESGETRQAALERVLNAPDWLAAVQAPRVSSYDEVIKLWQSEKRCCIDDKDKLIADKRTFFKACHKAVTASPDDNDIVFICLKLMSNSTDKTWATPARRFLIDHFFDYESRTDNCANCASADGIAQVVNSYVSALRHTDERDVALATVEQLLSERLSDISTWLQVDTYVSLGRLYRDVGMSDEQEQRITTAFDTLFALSETDEGVAKRIVRFERVYRQLVDQ